MASDDTLLSHLVPKLTGGLEDAATDAVAYILNKSDEAMGALNGLLQHGGFEIEPVKRVQTQVSYEAGDSRPDMTGYDKSGKKRLLVESKFGAALLEGQASSYIKLLDEPAVLLFVAPEVRVPTLWTEIQRQLESSGQLEDITAPPEAQRAKPIGTERHLMVMSWNRLLDGLAAEVREAAVEEDIRQLRGLVLQQDAQAFRPIHAEDLDPEIGRLVANYSHLVDGVYAKAKQEDWMAIHGLTSYPYGHGRYSSLSGVQGYVWFGLSHEQWAKYGDTPLWLQVDEEMRASLDEIGERLNVQPTDRWVPIIPSRGVEYAEVLDDVLRQLRVITTTILAHA